MRRYQSADEDSGRWARFRLRPDDIVISTRSKHGTTWVQMICVLLVRGADDLPRPLAELSPWLDWLALPEAEVMGALDRQAHRRVIKTHTPLDGLPVDAGAHYVVVARHPLDAAVSLYHQSRNIDRSRHRALTGAHADDAAPEPDPAPEPAAEPEPAPEPVDVWLRRWVATDADPSEALDSLPGVMHHLTDAWHRRHHPRVTLVHYDDLQADLPRQMRRLADTLGIACDDVTIERLAGAAGFEAMRAAGVHVAPDPVGVLRNPSAFFRRGRSGAGSEILGADGVAAYEARAAALAPDDLLDWLHRRSGADPGPVSEAGGT